MLDEQPAQKGWKYYTLLIGSIIIIPASILSIASSTKDLLSSPQPAMVIMATTTPYSTTTIPSQINGSDIHDNGTGVDANGHPVQINGSNIHNNQTGVRL